METSRIAKNVEGPKVENHRESKSKYGIETKSCGIVNLRNCNGPLHNAISASSTRQPLLLAVATKTTYDVTVNE